jgi:hypothetical protein
MMTKQGAYRFLESVSDRLNNAAPAPSAIRDYVNFVWDKSAEEKLERERVACKENLAFYNFAAAHIFELGKVTAKLDDDEMRQAFHCEYYKKFPEFSGGNSFRRNGHLFSKNRDDDASKIMERWSKAGTLPPNQAYPEAGLSSPFPFKIVFEAKLFTDESSGAAQKALVNGAYETAFYRGLPPSDGWDYDFGCLIAFDASDGAHLNHVWNSVAHKHLFWDDASVFIMIVRKKD